MQSAAEACFKTLSHNFPADLAGKRAQILCGPGNNGGDGAAIALLLTEANVKVEAVLFGRLEQTKGDARTNFERVRAAEGEQLTLTECVDTETWNSLSSRLSDCDIIVDALFGVGLSRPLEGLFAQVVRDVRSCRDGCQNRPHQRMPGSANLFVLSVDVPSGLDADRANLIGEAIEADTTVTFTAPKPANVLPPASHLNGKLVVADIGSPASLVDDVKPNLFLIQEADAREWLVSTRYQPESFKNTHGAVLIIAGSRGYSGAAVLCGDAAMRSGAGLVTIATPASAQTAIAASVMPEVITTSLAETDRGAISDEAVNYALQLTEKADVVAIGPGLTATDERTKKFMHEMIGRRRTPVVIDADGLNCLAPWPADLKGSDELPLVLTPHPGEMKRLIGTGDRELLTDRVAVARGFATKNKVVLVLKGSRSLIASPDGRVFINPTGNAGLGTAGAGDTLTGLIAGFLAQSRKEKNFLAATIAALYVGGLAGDFAARELGMRTMVASDIRNHFSEAIRSLDSQGELP